MKNKVVIGILLFVLVALIAVIAVVFGNHPERIEKLYKDTLTAVDSKNTNQLKELFMDNVSKINPELDDEIAELNDFYEGKLISINAIDNLTVYHETDNYFKAYATVQNDTDSYFICITATGSRIVDQPKIKQLIIEKSDTFAKKKVLEKKLLKEYSSQARTYGITIRTPGDHGAHAKENKLMSELEKTVN